MCELRAAPFLQQKDSFSSCDAHAFNRHLPMQMPVIVKASQYTQEIVGFRNEVSPAFPSFHMAPTLLGLAFVAGF